MRTTFGSRRWLEELTACLERKPEDLMAYANARFFYDGDGKYLGTQFGPDRAKSRAVALARWSFFPKGILFLL